MSFEAFKELAMAEIGSVSRIARSLARGAADADDLVQETYLKAIRFWKQFTPGEGGIRPWLLRILHTSFLNSRKAKGREQAKMADVEIEEVAQAAPETAPAETDWSHLDDRLLAALDQLPSPLRVTITMWGMEGLTYRQIAEVMEVPIGTVMSRLHRARSMLQQSLEEVARERGLKRE